MPKVIHEITKNAKNALYIIYSHQNYIKKSRLLNFSGFFAGTLLCLFTFMALMPTDPSGQIAEAATGSASTTSLTLTTGSDTAKLDLMVNSAGGTFSSSSDSEKAKFTVTTTNYTGYTLTILAKDNSGKLLNNEEYLESISSAIDSDAFDNADYNGKWGYMPSKLNSADNENFLPAPTTETILNTTSGANSTADNYTIALGARADYTKPSGTYSNTFILTATANKINYSVTYVDNSGIATTMPSPNPQSGDTDATSITLSSTAPVREGYEFKGWCTADTSNETCSSTTYQPGDTYPIDQTTISSITLYAMWEQELLAMQDLPDSECTTTATQVKDNRDGQTYTIQRLADGNCWLLDNLRLDLTDSNVQSNLTSSTTNAADIILGYLKNGGGSDPYATKAVSSAWTSDSQNSYTEPYIATAYKDDVATVKYGSGSGKVGVYYNYCAASAGSYCYPDSSSSGNASQDICPSGWRMPDGDTLIGSYFYLYNTGYGSKVVDFQRAMSVSISGYFYSGIQSELASNSRFWSTTRLNSASMNNLAVSKTAVYPQNANGRALGASVRCVKKSATESAGVTYMQDLANLSGTEKETLMEAMGEGTSYSLTDSRDNQIYTVAKINGNLWMTRNLAIGCNGSGTSYGSSILSKTLTSANSNVATTYSTPTALLSDDPTRLNTINSADYNTARVQCNATYGGYYNYAATSAGTITGPDNSTEAVYDICPGGWRLPTSTEMGSVRTYGAAFSAVWSGGYAFGTLSGAYSGGSRYWWSSTPGTPEMKDGDSSTRMILGGEGGGLSSSIDLHRFFGASVRCIAETRTIADAVYLQDVTSAIGKNTPVGTTASLKDNRDGQTYTVKKLDDGNIWMIDNLNLGATTLSTDLTSANTNLSSTITASTFNGWKKTKGSASYAAAEFIPVSGTDSTSGTTYGTLYNYCAASAKTICSSSNSNDASYDLCPKGWRLPTGGSSGEFQALYNNSSYNTNTKMRASVANGGAAFALAGGFYKAAHMDQDDFALYWSSTRYNSTIMYGLILRASYVGAADSDDRGGGSSIRCILK